MNKHFLNSRPALAGSSGPRCWPAGRQSRRNPPPNIHPSTGGRAIKYYNLDPLPIVSGDPAELFFDDREDCEFARTLAARTAAIISQVRRYTVTRYTYPGRQIIVSPSTRTPGGWQVTFYHP